MGDKGEQHITFAGKLKAILGQDCNTLTKRLKGSEFVFAIKWEDALPLPFVQEMVNYPRRAG